MPKTTRVVIIISDVDVAPSFEYLATGLSKFANLDLSFCFISHSFPCTAVQLDQKGYKVSYIKSAGKSSWPLIFLRVLRLLLVQRPHVVHCHLLAASVIGLVSSFLLCIPVRCFTRHHGASHHFHHRKGLVLDFICNSLSTNIVSISPVTTRILNQWEKVPLKKISYIPHGFPSPSLCRYPDTISDLFRQKHRIPRDKRIIGTVSRFEHDKGLLYTIEAFSRLLSRYDDIHLLMLNARGSDLPSISTALAEIPDSAKTLIEFDRDILSAYALMDVFVHVPVDLNYESFGQVYVEAASSLVPMVCTLSGIATEFIVNNQNALVVPYRDSCAIYDAISTFLDRPDLCHSLSCRARSDVQNLFSLEAMCTKLYSLYVSDCSDSLGG